METLIYVIKQASIVCELNVLKPSLLRLLSYPLLLFLTMWKPPGHQVVFGLNEIIMLRLCYKAKVQEFIST